MEFAVSYSCVAALIRQKPFSFDASVAKENPVRSVNTAHAEQCPVIETDVGQGHLECIADELQADWLHFRWNSESDV